MRRNIVCVVLFVFSAGLYAQTTTELENVLELVYKNDPKLSSYFTKKDAAETGIAQNGNLPDPKVTLGLTNMPVGSFSFSQEPMTGKTIALSQGFPFPGKLSLKKEITDLDAQIVLPEMQEYKLALKKKVEQLYWKVLQNRNKVKLTRELQTLLSGVEDILSTRYSLDQASNQQIVSVQLEQTILEDKLEQYSGNVNSLTAELQILTGVDDLSISADFPEIKNDYLAERETISAMIKQSNPGILKKRLQLEKNERKISLAEKNYYPDFNVTLQYSQRDKLASTGKELDDFLSVLVGFNIPLNYGGKRDAEVEEAKLTKKFLDEQLKGISQNITSLAVREIENLKTVERRIKILEEGLLPQSEVNFNAAISGLGTGINDYLSVTDALEKIISVKFRYIDLQYNYFNDKTNLEYVLGTDLNGVNNE